MDEYKNIEVYQWSMGNGQCPVCCGAEPNKYWWTDTVGHLPECCLADTINKAGIKVIYEHTNPHRSIGAYFGEDRTFRMIRYSDPDKREKLEIEKRQNAELNSRIKI